MAETTPPAAEQIVRVRRILAETEDRVALDPHDALTKERDAAALAAVLAQLDAQATEIARLRAVIAEDAFAAPTLPPEPEIDIPAGTVKDHARDKQPAVAYACLYQKLARVAREQGYALAMHGSLSADLDLVAVPWTHEAVSDEALCEALARAIPGSLHRDTFAGARPGGVKKHVIHLGGGPYLDICATPRSPKAAPHETPETT